LAYIRLQRLGFHYTPSTPSWLNMVEIEIRVLRGQCLDRRVDAPKRLISEIAAWEQQRNVDGPRHQLVVHSRQTRAKMAARLPLYGLRVIIIVPRN